MKIIIYILFLIAVVGCSTETDNPPRGYAMGTDADVRQEILKSCWYCGDYTGPVTGSSTLTSPQRICGASWGSCPSNTTLGDGSTWLFIAGCRCDG